jgi:hypothetical protein
MAEEVAVLIDVVREVQKSTSETIVMVLEEVGDYSLWERSGSGVIGALARNGRHNRIAVVFVTQAAVEIPKSARRQMSRIVSFSQSDPADIAALESLCGTEFVESVTAWRHGDAPAVWTIPSLLSHTKGGKRHEVPHLDEEQPGSRAHRRVPSGPVGRPVCLPDDYEPSSKDSGSECPQPEVVNDVV